MTAPRTAFVLSGGGSLAAAQAGMLRALYERGIAPDLLVGTSAGALNAAFVASRPQTVATARELARVWCGVQREDVFPVSMRALIGGFCGQRDHLVSDRALRRLVGRYIEFENLAHPAVPVHVVAFDVVEGREVLLSEGAALDASRRPPRSPASSPVVMGDRRLAHEVGPRARQRGGIHQPARVKRAQRAEVRTTGLMVRNPRGARSSMKVSGTMGSGRRGISMTSACACHAARPSARSLTQVGPHAATSSARRPALSAVQRPQPTRCWVSCSMSFSASSAAYSFGLANTRVSAAFRTRRCSSSWSLAGPISSRVLMTRAYARERSLVI